MKVTTVEIAEALVISQQAVRKMAKKQGWKEIGRARPGGNIYDLNILPLGKAELYKIEGYLAKRDILEKTLPEVTIDVAPQAALPATIAAEVPALRGPAIPLKAQDNQLPLTEKQKSQAMARYELVRLYSAYLASAGWKRKTKARDEFILRYRSEEWPEIKEMLGDVAWKTIESWKVTLRSGDGDPLALADTRGSHLRGTSKIEPEQMQILRAFAFHPNRLRVSHAIRLAKKVMASRGIDTISEATCRRYVNTLKTKEYPEWVFYREGEQALENECGYTIDRDFSLLEVGDMLTADGHVLNFEVLNPATGKPCRPVLILWYDTHSNMPLGWELMPTENTQAIHVALRRAIISLGKLPKVAYLDNGRAFKAKYFTNSQDFDNGAISGLYGRLGIDARFTMAYHGQSKTVERFFGTMLEVESIMPTYIGNSIDNKPARMHRGERLHHQLWERYGGAKVAISMEQAHTILATWFDDYARRPQRGNLDGKSPLEVFQAGRGPGVDRAKLIELMMSVELKQVQKTGIKMFGQNYYHPALYGRKLPVVVRYDLMDKESLYLFEPDGSFLGAAEPKVKVHPCATVLGTERDRELLKEEFACKNKLKSLTVGPARKALREEILPHFQQQMEEIGYGIEVSPIEKQEGKLIALSKKQKKEDWAKVQAEAEERLRLQKEQEVIDFDLNLEQLNEADRYEELIKLTCAFDAGLGPELSPQWAGFMGIYEQTAEYDRLADYWESCWMKYRSAVQAGVSLQG